MNAMFLMVLLGLGPAQILPQSDTSVSVPGKKPDRVAAVHGRAPTALQAPNVTPTAMELPATDPLRDPAITGGPRLHSNQIGYVRPMPAELASNWPWELLPDGAAVARVEYHSPEAKGLRMKIAGLTRSAGVELRVYDPVGTAVLGPYSSPILDDDGAWWAPVIFGDTIGIELYRAHGAAGLDPQITEVTYISCHCHSGSPGDDAASCENHVACSFPDWQNDAGAVVLLIFNSGSCCAFCTGSLLNREPFDDVPIFATANHCIGTQSEANSVEVFWNWQASDCATPLAPDFNSLPRNDGALLLKRRPTTDFSLLGLYEPPAAGANEYYLGWYSGTWTDGEYSRCIHHPQGAPKRISFGTTSYTWDNVDFSGNGCGPDIEADVRSNNWTDGITEPGSSGAPIFDQYHRFRGVVTGGNCTCPNCGVFELDYFGQFEDAFRNLKYYMANASIASPVFVNGAVAGDPENNGDSERGTSVQPFNTVYEATFAVRGGDDVEVAPGAYNEQFVLRRPMTLKSNSGTVRIGSGP